MIKKIISQARKFNQVTQKLSKELAGQVERYLGDRRRTFLFFWYQFKCDVCGKFRFPRNMSMVRRGADIERLPDGGFKISEKISLRCKGCDETH